MKKIYIFFVILSLVAFLSTAGFAQSYAITNGTVVTVTRGTLENATVVISNGKITAVGVGVRIPYDAERIDASGKFVYPGMIDVNTSLGLSDVSGIWQTTDNRETGTYNSHIRASQGVNHNSRQFNIQRYTGVTTAIAVPSGGVISGQEVLLNLDGWSLEDRVVKDPVAMKVTFPTAAPPRRRFGGPAQAPQGNLKERAAAQLKEFKELLTNAGHYAKAIEDYESGKFRTPPPADLTLKALIPVVKGEIPMTITVNGVDDIRSAMKFVKEMKIKAVFAGVSDAFKIAEEIAEAGIPVLYSSLLQLPSIEEPYDLYYTIPTILYRAGVKFAFSVPSHSDVRNLPFMAGMAAAYGLPKDEALKAVTIYPAEMYGVDNILGSIDTGKMANIVITDGDLLEPRTHVTVMFIRGEKVDLTAGEDYQLYQKYLNRPKKVKK